MFIASTCLRFEFFVTFQISEKNMFCIFSDIALLPKIEVSQKIKLELLSILIFILLFSLELLKSINSLGSQFKLEFFKIISIST